MRSPVFFLGRRSLRTQGLVRGALALLLAACCLPTVLSAAGAGGIEGTFEYTLDAPWRMEPVSGGRAVPISYGPIPILITIHDAMDVAMDPFDGIVPVFQHLSLGEFCSLKVTDPQGLQVRYDFDELDEVELTRGRWPWPSAANPVPQHQLCRGFKGESCSALQDVSQTSEWFGFKWHTVENPVPGSTVDFTLEVELTRHPGVDCAEAAVSVSEPPALLTLRNRARVHFAAEPLPRFGDRWLYGDLHYHSQGTDNEGESGHAYRGVVRALGAMGVDFALASDHASNSEQIIDSDVVPQVFDPEHVDIHNTGDTLRDMSLKRFEFDHGLVYGSDGVNEEAALERDGGLPQTARGHGIVPTLLLGGEVDAIPELAPGSEGDTFILYGNGRRMQVSKLCNGWHADGLNPDCDVSDLLETAVDGVLVRDVQGFNTIDYGRDHLVYLPATGDLEVPGQSSPQEPMCISCTPDLSSCSDPMPCSQCTPADRCTESSVPTPQKTFIASSTGSFGGASRRLTRLHEGRPPLLPEIERKGYAFLAHPMAASPGNEGPASVPWTQHMLEQAWSSPSILGLQLWNEDTRLYSPVRRSDEADPTRPAFDRGYERNEEPYGPKPVNRARDGFLSAAGVFELWPWDPLTGEWTHTTSGLATNLKSGLHVWDLMLRWGLDSGCTSQLDWLPPGEPRRFFMAGGSDAHGDLNYHRDGYFLGTDQTTDTAIATPRNLVEALPDSGTPVAISGLPPAQWPLRYDHGEIVEALAAGSFSVTDGAALRIVVDENGNGSIDASDPGLGEVLHRAPTELTLPLLVEWKSTPEFGGVARIELYVGTESGAQGRTYGPYRHGPRSPFTSAGLPLGSAYVDASGRSHEILDDRYWRVEETPTTTLRIPAGAAGPAVDRCDAQVRYCVEEPGDEIPEDNGGTPDGNSCYTKTIEVACSLCPALDNEGELIYCDPNGLTWPGEEPEAPIDNFAGVAAVTLDLKAFEPIQDGSAEGYYIRAFARTHGAQGSRVGCNPRKGDCLERYAFTNPIWVIPDGESSGGGEGDDL
ncbi:MAG: hypothetical protein KDD47_17890 [Acidobacteria bacterium]|nr:hypothetical protein [Acidobacteriota bacterium]